MSSSPVWVEDVGPKGNFPVSKALDVIMKAWSKIFGFKNGFKRGFYLPEKKGLFDTAMKTWPKMFGFNTNTLG